jgi:hypothetical protein
MAAKNRHNHIDCLGSALPDEEYFVLLARDPAMPALLGIWASLRVGNAPAATENFMLLMSPELVQHYQKHPDIAKSQEAVDTANRAAEWREANLNGPDGKPTWKQSLVRPQMISSFEVLPPLVESDIVTEHPPCENLARRGIDTKASMADLEGHSKSCDARATGFYRDCSCGADISHANAPAIR